MFPKRGAIALSLTGLALALLLSFKTPSDTTATTASSTDLAAANQAVASPTAAAASGSTGASSAGSSSARPAPEATTAPAATPAPVTTATPPPASAASGTYTGDAVATRYGTVQVQVTIENGTITDVAALALPNGDPRSAMISQRVEPYLRSSALAVQSAQIDLVSGATYTSMGYAQSLQSALDQAGL